MKIKKQSILFIALFTLCSSFIKAQNYTNTFNEIIKKELEHQSPGGSVLVAKDGNIIYNYHYGKANLELDVATSSKSVYRIASLSKQFTAVAILKLAEEQKLSLNDDIKKYLPNYPVQDRTITLEHLLSHTSGIKDYLNIEGFNKAFQRQDMSPKELIDFFKNEPMNFEAGSQYQYSSSGYIILGYIIEAVSGMSYEDYMKEAIFIPIGLNNTFYDNTKAIIKNRVSGYKNTNEAYENIDFLSMTLPYAAGSLASTSEDLFKWNEALKSKKIISSKSLNKAYTAFKLNTGKSGIQGYGWEIGNVQGVKAVKHSGGINGFITYALSIPEKDIYVAILTNSENTNNLGQIASKIAAIAMDSPYKLIFKDIPKSRIEALNGVYKNNNGVQKTIRFEDGSLLMFDRGKTKNKLIPYAKNNFFLENSLTTFSIKKVNDDIQLVENNTYQINTWKRIDKNIKSFKAEKVKLSKLKKYQGKYELGPDFYFSIKIENNTLIGQIRDDKKELIPLGNNQFIARDIDAKITFNLNENQEVISLTLDQGREMTAKKIY
ncbi:serine hydrolase domain-containing protein [uncultured Croceitalea sp.]|uniref:serine hydrolase domain-containing protein n=1 Tax=uncultured Croceitalea sp. TaxID=1798908 RepID=UPI00374F4ECA